MLIYRVLFLIAALAVLPVVVGGCSKRYSGPRGPWTLGIRAYSTSASAANASGGAVFSGAPELLRLSLRAVSGGVASGDSYFEENFWTSGKEEGAVLDLVAGEVSLAGTGLDSLQVPVGRYSWLKLEFSRVAWVRGCVSGTFATPRVAGSGDLLDQGPVYSRYGERVFTSENVSAGTYRYCTRTDRSELNALPYDNAPVGALADYLDRPAAEAVEVDLGRANDRNISADGLREGTVTIMLPVEFEVTEGAAAPARATAVINLDRLLRFYTNTHPKRLPPYPGKKTGTAYFFASNFEDAVAFVSGEPGAVEGYEWSVTFDGAARTGWLDLVKGAQGEVAMALGVPDNDFDASWIFGVSWPTRNEAGDWALAFERTRAALLSSSPSWTTGGPVGSSPSMPMLLGDGSQVTLSLSRKR